jgi:hypothetical protein
MSLPHSKLLRDQRQQLRWPALGGVGDVEPLRQPHLRHEQSAYRVISVSGEDPWTLELFHSRSTPGPTNVGGIAMLLPAIRSAGLESGKTIIHIVHPSPPAVGVPVDLSRFVNRLRWMAITTAGRNVISKPMTTNGSM